METAILNTLVYFPHFSTIFLMRYSMIYPPIGTDGDRSQGAMDDVWAPVGVAAVLVDHDKRKPIITNKIISGFV